MKTKVENLHKYYVYVLCKPNGTVFYVGKGKGDRINDHFQKSKLRHNSRKISTIKKYGDSIKREILCYFSDENTAYEYEEWLIAHYKLTGDGGTLTNIAKTRYEYCKEFSLNVSKSQKKKFKDEIIINFYIDFFNNAIDRKILSLKYNMTLAEVSRISRGYRYVILYEDYILSGKVKDNREKLKRKRVPNKKEYKLTNETLTEISKKYLSGDFNLVELADEYNTSSKYLSSVFSGVKRKGKFLISTDGVFIKKKVSKSTAIAIYNDHLHGTPYSKLTSFYSIPTTTIARICNREGCYSFLNNLSNA